MERFGRLLFVLALLYVFAGAAFALLMGLRWVAVLVDVSDWAAIGAAAWIASLMTVLHCLRQELS